MIRKCIAIGISTVSVILLILTSLSNVVGYQTVQTSQQNIIKERINQKELLFQTICDIANNKEIQRIILKSQISRGIVPPSEIPVITKNQLKRMYFIGLILSKVISKSRMQSMMGKYQFNTPEMQKEIGAVIEKNTILKGEVTQLSCLSCNCGLSNFTWRFPLLCYLVLFPLFLFFFYIMTPIVMILAFLGLIPYPNSPLIIIDLIVIIATWYVSYEVLDCTWWGFIPI